VTSVSFVPGLSERSLSALDIQKNFLLEQGYIKNEFKVRDWADDRFLQEALRSL
jgi:ABC-type nitrate/sulfonate/bicarbonate transport system substrate-binding protein